MNKDKKILIQNGQGKRLLVFEKAYEVVYKSSGYYPIGEKLKEDREEHQNDVDIASLSKEELKDVKNDDLKAYLDELEIEYKSSANKNELIALIVGEDDNDDDLNEDDGE